MTAAPAEVVAADLVWTGDRFEPDGRIAIDADGRIAAVGRLDAEPTRRLDGRALVPGLVSAHSHAFQRGLRGRAQGFPDGAGSFWTWREAMYGLVEGLDEATLRALAARAFAEMRDAGITAVGEFHYLHHGPGDREAEDGALGAAVLDAAAEVGIRIALLPAYYRRGGIDEPLRGAQLRFATPDPAAYLELVAGLADRLDRATQSLGAAVHSVRAADPDEIAAIAEAARGRGLVLHLHLAEQRAEVEACQAAYGRSPTALVLDALGGDAAGAVAVHGTHAGREDLGAWLDAGGRLCLCPLTEADLGDGIPDLAPALDRLDRLSLGTDANLRISLVEEMRWIEYGQRLRDERRGALVDGRVGLARALLAIATEGGAAALGIDAGRIAPGRWADLAAIDLGHPALAGVEPDGLLEAWIFGGGNESMAGTFVAGEWRPTGG